MPNVAFHEKMDVVDQLWTIFLSLDTHLVQFQFD